MNTHSVQDFVVKGKEIFVGLEDSKRTWKIAVRSEGMLIHQTAMEARYPLLKSYLSHKFPECTIHVLYEAGFRGFNLYDELAEDGIHGSVVPPHLVTEPKVNRVKTDKRDARRLALMLENGDLPSVCDVPDKERREDRQVSRTLVAVQKNIIRTRNQIRRFLEFHGIEVNAPGRWGRGEFRALKDLALSPVVRGMLDIYLAMLEELWVHQKRLRLWLRALCSKPRYQKTFALARSVPGIGWLTAIRLVLELGEDLSRFSSGKKIAAFIGLTPGEYSTGETEWKGRITGMGSGFIRAALIESSWVGVRKDPALLGKFTRVWRGTGSKKKAIVAVARVLIIRLRACVVSETPYAMGVVR